MADLAILRTWNICTSFESESKEESSEYVVRGTMCLAGSSFEAIDVKGDGGGSGVGDGAGSGTDDCFWAFARCRVVRGSRTVGFLCEEDSLTGNVAGGEPGGSRTMIMIMGLDVRVRLCFKKKWNLAARNDKEH